MTRYNPEIQRYGGGTIDVAIQVVIVGAGVGGTAALVAYGATLGKLLAQDTHYAIIANLQHLRRKAIKARGDTHKAVERGSAISIRSGPYNFYIIGDVPDEEVARRLEVAVALIEGGAKPTDGPLGWSWSDDEDSWVPERE